MATDPEGKQKDTQTRVLKDEEKLAKLSTVMGRVQSILERNGKKRKACGTLSQAL